MPKDDPNIETNYNKNSDFDWEKNELKKSEGKPKDHPHYGWRRIL